MLAAHPPRYPATVAQATLRLLHPWELGFAVAVSALGVLASTAGLTFDEAYYLWWAEHPQTGYLDHPPLVAWLHVPVAWPGVAPGLARAPDLLCGLCAVAALTVLARRAWGAAAARRTALLVVTLPILLAGFLHVGPDAPLLAASALFLLALHAAGERDGWRWGAAGVAWGVAGLAKYTAVLLLLPWLVSVLLRPKTRRFAWLAPAAAVVTVLPWLAANGELTFQSLAFQWSLGARHLVDAPGWLTLAEFTAGQALLGTPPVVLGTWMAWRAGDRHARLAAAWGLSILLPLAALSSRQALEANWPMVAWGPCALAVAGHSRRHARAAVAAAGAVALLCGALVLGPWPAAARLLADRYAGWAEVSLAVEDCGHRYARPGWHVLGGSRREAALLHQALGRYALPGTDDAGRFRFLSPVDVAENDAVWIVDGPEGTPTRAGSVAREHGFTSVVACGTVTREGPHQVDLQQVALYVLRR